MPAHMLSKVAESLALRKAFPEQFAGAYTEFEDVSAGTEEDKSAVESINAEFEDEQETRQTNEPAPTKEDIGFGQFLEESEGDNRSDLGEFEINHTCRFTGKKLKDIPEQEARDYMRVLETTDKRESVALLAKMKAYYGA